VGGLFHLRLTVAFSPQRASHSFACVVECQQNSFQLLMTP
jgi:hypothetical protein